MLVLQGAGLQRARRDRRRLDEFLYAKIGSHLARREQKESFALYAYGIVGDGERKSVEPIAARATGDAEECERMQARIA